MNKQRKVKKEYKEEIIKEDKERISKEENLDPYTNVLGKKKRFPIKIKDITPSNRPSILFKTLKRISVLSSYTLEEMVCFAFYQGNIDDEGYSIRSKSINSNIQVPDYSNERTKKTKAQFSSAESSSNSIIRIPRKFNTDLVKELTKDNVIGNFINGFTRVWYCLYPIYIIIAIFHLIYLVMYYVKLGKVTVYPCENVILCIIITHFFIGIYGLIQFRKNDLGDFTIVNWTLGLAMVLSIVQVIIPHFEYYIGKVMYRYLKGNRLFIYIYYGILFLFQLLTLIINIKGIKFYTEYHKRCLEKEILLTDLN